jgi:hypothetical protein
MLTCSECSRLRATWQLNVNTKSPLALGQWYTGVYKDLHANLGTVGMQEICPDLGYLIYVEVRIRAYLYPNWAQYTPYMKIYIRPWKNNRLLGYFVK